MKNPFQFGKVVHGKQFCNRQLELQEIEVIIKNGKSLWLYSPPRFGKTSLVKKAFSQITDVKTIYFDLFNIRDEKEFAAKYLNALAHEIIDWKQGVTSVLKNLTGYLKNVTPTISLDEDGNPSIGIVMNQNDLSQTIESILDLPQKLNYPKPICIAFDEFQEIERFSPSLKKLMSSIFRNQQKVSYFLLGSKKASLNALFLEAKSPFFQFGEKINLAPISQEDLTSYIKTMFNDSGLAVLNETIIDVLHFSECHPHYTQYSAYVAWNLIYQGIQQDDDFKQLWIARIMESQSASFRTIFEQLNANQRKVLYALSDAEKQNILSNDTMIKYELPPKSTINTALTSLLQRTIILKLNGYYKFENPIFKVWINNLYD